MCFKYENSSSSGSNLTELDPKVPDTSGLEVSDSQETRPSRFKDIMQKVASSLKGMGKWAFEKLKGEERYN